MTIEYVVGDATSRPTGNANILLIHIVNNRGGFGKGFAENLATRYPIVKDEYRTWYGTRGRKGNTFQLGNVQWVSLYENFYVGNMLCQNGYMSPDNPIPLDYNALDKCLTEVARVARFANAIVQAPKFGAGLAGGDWKFISELVEDAITTPVRIFTLS